MYITEGKLDVPSTVDVYGKDAYEFGENTISVNIPYDRIETSFSGEISTWGTPKRVTVNSAEVTERVTENLTKKEEAVLECIIKSRDITYEGLVEMLNVSRKTVAKHIKSLKEKGAIERIGSDKDGYWVVYRER